MKIIIPVMVVSIFASTQVVAWDYKETKDEMRESISYSAYLPSLNSEEFHYPYNGGSNLNLVFISKDNNTTDEVGVYLSKGQLFCQSEDKCNAHVKFDNGKIIELRLKISKDDSNTAMIEDARGFVESVYLSKKVIIEVPVYKEGDTQFKFDLDGFKWRGASKGIPFVTSIGSLPFGEKTEELDGLLKNGQQKANGEFCFELPKARLFKNIDLTTNAKYCGYEGYLDNVSAIYPYNKNNLKK